MPYCPKCGSEVNEEMAFCPKCGTLLKAQASSEPEEIGKRMEKMGREFGEKMERMGKDLGRKIETETKRAGWEERYEKGETIEIREFGFLGPLIGGLILLFLGLLLYLMATRGFGWELLVAFGLVLIGVIVIIASAYWVTVTRRLHLRT